ncbi:MAG: hypothetical protein WC497_04845 [Patescibacteria group bacterium]
MFQIELSHTFNVAEWRCPVTRIVDLDFVERAIRRGSLVTFTCAIVGCHHEGRAVEMRNLDRAKNDGVIVILCQGHACQMEDQGHRTYWLDQTLSHAVRGFQQHFDEVVVRTADSRPHTHLGLVLQAACRQQLSRQVA